MRAATASSGPTTLSDRCHRARSWRPASVAASASARCRPRWQPTSSRCSTAARTSGWRQWTLPSTSSITPAVSAGARSSSLPPTRASVVPTMATSSSASSAATPSAVSVAAGSWASWAPNESTSRSPMGRIAGRGEAPVRWPGWSARPASMRARGFPRVSSQHWVATAWSTPASPSRPTAASWGRPPRTSRSKSVRSSRQGRPVRWANRKPTRSASQRWATKTSDSRLDWSIHWASSTATRTGASSAAADTSASVAPCTASSRPSASTRPNAPRRARAWLGSSWSSRSSSGRTTADRPLNASPFSNSTPVARSTVNPRRRASRIVQSTRADLPRPASPERTVTCELAEATASSMRPSEASSSSRPTGCSTVVIVRCSMTIAEPPP